MSKVTYRCSELKEMALESLHNKWNQACIVSLIYCAIQIVGIIISYQGEFGNAGSFFINLWDVINLLFTVLVLYVLSYGFEIFFLRFQRKEQVNTSAIFDGFKRYSDVVLTAILICIYIFLWALLLIIPCFIKSYSYRMTYFVMYANGLTKNKAIEERMRLMDGNKWKLFVLDLSFIGWI